MKRNNIVATLQLLVVAILLSSCAHKYHAPDDKKLTASTGKLQKAIEKSHRTAAKVKEKHAESEAEANSALMNSFDIDEKLKHLFEQAPPELQPLVKAVQDVRTEQKMHQDNLEKRLEEERILLEQLAKDNQEVTTIRAENGQDINDYVNGAKQLAITATKENDNLRSQLWHQKLFKWLGFGGIGLVIALFIFGIIAWKTGKLAIWAGKVASKV